jgi:3-oxoacyl-[acyl-carrier protein] reductase
MFNLEGKTALVTGATGGIGEAIAKSLQAQGARVALTGRKADVLESLAKEMGGDTQFFPCDLGEDGAGQKLIQDVEAALGSIDILVNNAGLTRDNIGMRMKDEEWDDVIQVNLGSVFRLTRAVLRGMMKRRFGRIINITSIVGVTGNAGQANYAASKAGMIGMSKSLAQEVASRGITINSLAPGFIKTAMTDVLTDQQKDKLLTAVPTGRLGSVDDIAAGVVYLASEEASYVTGQTLHINGGMAMI